MRIFNLAATVALLTVALAVPAGADGVDPCANPTIQAVKGKATIGTDGPDVIRGTEFKDTIDGMGGDDIICGRGGRDAIYGGLDAGDDRLYGGPGNDYLVGYQGNDQLYGQAGDDVLYVDHCSGGSGHDREYYLPTCEVYHSMEETLT